MAAVAVFIGEDEAELLLVAEGDLGELEGDGLGLAGGGGGELVSSGDGAEGDGGGGLTGGVGDLLGGLEVDACGAVELDERTGECGALIVVDLDDDGVFEGSSGGAELLAATGLDDGCAGGGGFSGRGVGWLVFASCGCGQHQQHRAGDRSLGHYCFSCLPEDVRVMRKAVRARASSSPMFWLGSRVPVRRACGFLSQAKIQAGVRREPTWVRVGPM